MLGSGSTGNAILLRGQRSLLIDAGFSCRTIEERMGQAGTDPSSLAAVVITHEHGDHSRGAARLAKRHGVPLVATAGTLRALGAPPEHAVPLEYGKVLSLDDYAIQLFRTEHDSAQPAGVRVDHGGHSIGYLTDTGRVTPEAERALADCGHIFMEANHDPHLLANGPYPEALKRRIRGAHGHLSNDVAAQLLTRLLGSHSRQVVLHHLSRYNNTPELALATVHAVLHRMRVSAPPLAAAPAHGPFGPFAF